MKVLVTGFNGQLGYDVVKRFSQNGVSAVGVDINDFDLTDRKSTIEYVKKVSPDVIVHCAAYTAVDKAEEDKEVAWNVNVNGTENIALAAKEVDAKFIYISTDYVFNGEGETPFETDDIKSPLNVYGETKLEGERVASALLKKLFIIRVSWVFGVNGKNFVKTMLSLSEKLSSLTVVSDQIGSPTYTYDLAKLICDMALTEKYGVYHATNEGYCSWYEFAKEIFKTADIEMKVAPVLTKDYITAAKRPLNSRLSKKKLDEEGFNRLPTWQDALNRYIKEIKEGK